MGTRRVGFTTEVGARQVGLKVHQLKTLLSDLPRPYSDLPLAGESFDALISLYVIYHGPLNQMREAVGEIHRVLRPGGLGLVTFLSTRSDRYGQGEEIAPDTFITAAGADSGVPHHFSDRTEVEELLVGFTRFELDLTERVEDGHRHSHWQAFIEK